MLDDRDCADALSRVGVDLTHVTRTPWYVPGCLVARGRVFPQSLFAGIPASPRLTPLPDTRRDMRRVVYSACKGQSDLGTQGGKDFVRLSISLSTGFGSLQGHPDDKAACLKV